ncbi:DUF1127 domain-containing protein [Halovulum sp. GXIMD14794]
MYLHATWLRAYASPDAEAAYRQANEARAAAWYGFTRRIGRLLAWPFARPLAWLERAERLRRNLEQLSALDDAQLADIGVHRGEIAAMAKVSAQYAGPGRLSANEARDLLELAARPKTPAKPPKPPLKLVVSRPRLPALPKPQAAPGWCQSAGITGVSASSSCV